MCAHDAASVTALYNALDRLFVRTCRSSAHVGNHRCRRMRHQM